MNKGDTFYSMDFQIFGQKKTYGSCFQATPNSTFILGYFIIHTGDGFKTLNSLVLTVHALSLWPLSWQLSSTPSTPLFPFFACDNQCSVNLAISLKSLLRKSLERWIALFNGYCLKFKVSKLISCFNTM